MLLMQFGIWLWSSICLVSFTSAFTEVISKASYVTNRESFPLMGYHPTTTGVGSRNHRSSVASTVVVGLTPLYELETPVSFLTSEDESYRTCLDAKGILNSDDDDASSPYVLCVAEEDDLPAISKMIVESFGAEAISMSGDLSPLEQAFLEPGVGLLNAYSGAVAYAEVLSGLRNRMKHRFQKEGNSNKDGVLSAPPIMDVTHVDAANIAGKSSLVLVLARRSSSNDDEMFGMDVLATVELRLQPTDAKIPFSYPWLDTIERNIAQKLGLDTPKDSNVLQPYLSNLCVAERARGRRIGKAMVRCVESIVADTWGFSKIYLHVDLENAAAYNLYKKEGYEDVGSRWNPFWAGNAADIAYFVKKLS